MRVNVDQLVVTKENPRITQASQASHDALVASLGTHGLIQPIVVRPIAADNDGVSTKFEVIAGTRRLAAIKQLGWTMVEVVENDAEYGVSELGAAENMMREAMHPLDECRVIARLVADGESIDAVAARFGQTDRWVEQRIKLTGLSIVVQKAFREGKIGMAVAQVFTMVDKKAQQDYLGKLKEPYQISAEGLRNHFLNSTIPASYALFPLEKYPKGSIVSDLFGDDTRLTDRETFHLMQLDAIKAVEAMMKDEGWGEVVTQLTGNDYKVSSLWVKVEGRIAKKDRGKHAVMITYTPSSGRVVVDVGWAKRKDAKKVKASASGTDDTTTPEAAEVNTDRLLKLDD